MALGKLLEWVQAGISGAKLLSTALGMTETVRESAPPAGTPNLRGAKLSAHNVYTIDQRVALIVKLVQQGATDPEIIAGARGIVSKKCGKEWCLKERDWRGEVVALFDQTRRDVRWVRDPDGVDFFSSAKNTLKMRGGDCDEFSSLLGARLRAIGYPVELVVVETHSAPVKGEYEHVYLCTGWQKDDGEWEAMFLDPSVDKPAGWHVPESQVVRLRSFAVPA